VFAVHLKIPSKKVSGAELRSKLVALKIHATKGSAEKAGRRWPVAGAGTLRIAFVTELKIRSKALADIQK
jgi:hypothetical protein